MDPAIFANRTFSPFGENVLTSGFRIASELNWCLRRGLVLTNAEEINTK